MARLYLRPINPIAIRELKMRMRGPRTFVLLAVYMGLLALLIFTMYLRKGASTSYSYGGSMLGNNFGPTRNYETGQDIYIAIFLYLLVTVAVITPGICGGLVSREVEDGTYDMLVVTPVRGRSVILGKLVAALSYLALLILAAFPLSCVVFMFGGVTIEHLLVGFAIVLMECLLLSVMSVFFSGLFRRTSLAVIATYSLAALLLLGVPLASSSLMTAINSDSSRPTTAGPYQFTARTDPAFDAPKRMLVFNPFAALGSVLAPNAPYRPGNTDELQYFPNSRAFWGNPTFYFATPSFAANSNFENMYRLSKQPVLPGGVVLWQGYLLVYLALTLFFTILSIAVVKPLPRQPGINPFGRLRVGRPRLKFPVSLKRRLASSPAPSVEAPASIPTEVADAPATLESEAEPLG